MWYYMSWKCCLQLVTRKVLKCTDFNDKFRKFWGDSAITSILGTGRSRDPTPSETFSFASRDSSKSKNAVHTTQRIADRVTCPADDSASLVASWSKILMMASFSSFLSWTEPEQRPLESCMILLRWSPYFAASWYSQSVALIVYLWVVPVKLIHQESLWLLKWHEVHKAQEVFAFPVLGCYRCFSPLFFWCRHSWSFASEVNDYQAYGSCWRRSSGARGSTPLFWPGTMAPTFRRVHIARRVTKWSSINCTP